MKKVFAILITLHFSLAANAAVLEAGVSVNEIPKNFYGTWRVNGKLDSTNARGKFRPQAVDFWVLKRVEDNIVLDNPMTGTKASVLIDSVEGDLIKFTRVVDRDDNQALVDSVSIRIKENKFDGINTLQLETYSLIDGSLMKKEKATYLIRGEKISD